MCLGFGSLFTIVVVQWCLVYTRIFNNYYHYVFAFPFIVYSFMIKNSNKAYIQLSILVQ